jgi:hypothetical protein
MDGVQISNLPIADGAQTLMKPIKEIMDGDYRINFKLFRIVNNKYMQMIKKMNFFIFS